MATPEGTYYGGDSVRDGLVRPLAIRSFEELVERYGTPRQLRVTREAYDRTYALGKDGEAKCFKLWKDGPWVSSCAYPEGCTKRSKDNAGLIYLLCLDVDWVSPEVVTEDGLVNYAQDVVDDIQTILDCCYPHPVIVHHTISSRDGRPSVRLIFPTVPFAAEHHPKAVAYVMSLLGWTLSKLKGRVESMNYSQPMFMPVMFEGDTVSPILGSRTTGKPIDVTEIPDDILEEVEDGARVYGYAGALGTGGGEGCTLSSMPIPGLRPEDMAEPLSFLDPDLSRPDWIAVMMGMRHQFRDEDEAQRAFTEVDDFSSQGEKYRGEEETYKQWASLRPEIPSRAPVTIRSVFKMAMERGWKTNKLAGQLQQSVEEWIAACEDGDDLLAEGVERIAAMPFINDVVQDALAVTLRARIKEVAGKLVSKPVIIKAIKKARRTERRTEIGMDENRPEWLRPIVFISGKNEFRSTVTGMTYTPAALDNTFSEKLMPTEPAEEEGQGGRPAILPTHFALNVVKIKRVDGLTYDPRHGGTEPFFERDGRTWLNEYRQTSLPALDPDNEVRAGKLWREHLAMLFSHPPTEDLFDNYVAWMIQNPGKKIRWMFIIQGAPRCGKTLACEIVGGAVGKANMNVVSPAQFVSDFNGWAYGAVWVVIEELQGKGASRKEVFNKAKEFVTNEDLPLNEKHEPYRMILNVANGAMLTNYHDSAYIEGDDGRYYPVFCTLQSREQVLATTASGHFERVKNLKNHAGAMRSYWLNREVPADFPVDGPAPESPWRAELVEESKAPGRQAIEDLVLDDSFPLIGKDIIHAGQLNSLLIASKFTARPSHYLYEMGYDPWLSGRRVRVNGSPPSAIWVHREHYDADIDGPADKVLREREEKES